MATANDRITFRMIRRWGVDVNFLTRAEIYKPDGSLFYAATTNTLRLDTTLITSGTYTIWIMDDNGHETGGYGLNLERLKPLTGDTITYDGVTHNDITYAPEVDAYNFMATANDRITFRMIRRWGVDVNFLTRAEIYKPDGSLFYAATTNTLRLDTTLITGGTYTIWIMDDNGHETGGYGLNLERLKPLTGDTITYDGVTHNDITYAPEVDAYNFMATANDRITFRMIRRWGVDVNFLTRAEIYKPDGSLFYAATTNTLRLDTTLVTGGTYTIWIMDDNGHETGSYELNLTGDSFPPNPVCIEPNTGNTIAWFPLDESTGTVVTDIINGATAQLINGTIHSLGRVDSAVEFNGANGYLISADNDKWAFGKKDFTIEFWARFNTNSEGTLANPGDVFISNDEGPGATRKWYFALGGGSLFFYTNTPGVGAKYLVQTPFSPVIDRWYHLAVTRQVNNFSIYINGVLKGSATNADSIPNPNAPLRIGLGNEISTTGYMNGLLDEVTIYNKALSSAEILAITKAANGGKCKKLTITTTLPPVLINDSLLIQLNAVYGTPPYKWSITKGSLPSGVALSSGGVLNGISKEAKEFVFRVRVTDGIGNFVEREFLLNVLVTLPPSILRISKTGTVAVPGRVLDYFIIVENVGNVNATNVEVFEALQPSRFSLISVSPNGTAVDSTLAKASLVDWIIPNLPPRETKVLSYKVRLNPSTPIGSVLSQSVFAKEFPTANSDKSLFEAWHKCIGAILELVTNQQCLVCASFCRTSVIFCKPSIITLPLCISAVANCVRCLLTPDPNDPEGSNCITKGKKIFDECNKAAGETNRAISAFLQQQVFGPIDPNEKLVVANEYIKPDQTLIYPIHYENIGDVEALDVFVWDTLDSNLDTSTLQMLTPGATYNTASKSIKWNLLNKNLQPGATDNVLLSIKPKPNLPSGTAIKNKAYIQFEIFDTVQTNEVINIIDAIPPESAMDALPAVTSATDFLLTWNGTDSIGEIESYSIFVSENGKGFNLYKETRDPFLVFTGEAGKTYEFISIAKDMAGNLEIKNPIAEAVTTILYKTDSVCNGANTTMVSNISGSGKTYQWQVDDGTGYKNIIDTGIYTGTSTDTLKLNSVPSPYYGYRYRNIIFEAHENDTSFTHILIFANTWTGAVSTAWENTGNWSCGSLPDENTDVIITNGVTNNPELNSDRSCHSISLQSGSTLKVSSNYKLTITGPPKQF